MRTLILSLLLLAACRGAPAIQAQSLPDATVDEVFLVRLDVEKGKGPLVWSLAEGDLPEGLVLNPAGVLSGTPERAGSYTFTLDVQDARGRTDQRAYDLEVNWSGPALPCDSLVEVELATGALTSEGELDPTQLDGITWVTLPLPEEEVTRIRLDGITSSGFGYVSLWIGGPEARPGDTDVGHYLGQHYVSAFSDPLDIDPGTVPSITALRALGQPITLMIASPEATGFTLESTCSTGPVFQDLHPPPTLVGEPLTANFNVFGDNSGVTIWTDDPLPPWIIFDESNGRISGTAEEEGVWEFTISAEDADGYVREEQASLATYAHHPISCGETVTFTPRDSMYEGERNLGYDPLSYRVFQLAPPVNTGQVIAELTGAEDPALEMGSIGAETISRQRGGTVADGTSRLTVSGGSWPTLEAYAEAGEPLHLQIGHWDYGATPTLSLQVTCDQAPRMGQASLPVLQPGTASTHTLSSSGGVGPVVWEASGLPDGVVLSADGVLTADGLSSNSYEVDVTLTDSDGLSSTETYALNVGWPAACGGLPILTCGDTDGGTFEKSIYNGGPPSSYSKQICIPGPTAAEGDRSMQLGFTASEVDALTGRLYAPGQPAGGDRYGAVYITDAGLRTLPLTAAEADYWLDAPMFVELTAFAPTEWSLAIDCE